MHTVRLLAIGIVSVAVHTKQNRTLHSRMFSFNCLDLDVRCTQIRNSNNKKGNQNCIRTNGWSTKKKKKKKGRAKMDQSLFSLFFVACSSAIRILRSVFTQIRCYVYLIFILFGGLWRQSRAQMTAIHTA